MILLLSRKKGAKGLLRNSRPTMICCQRYSPFSDPEQSFPKLASLLGSTTENDIISIPEKRGEGTIKKFQADYGLLSKIQPVFRSGTIVSETCFVVRKHNRE